jgi:hypothetical protein
MHAGIQFAEQNLEALRLRLSRMTDGEVLSYGQCCKYMCSPTANMGKPPRQEFAMQLVEARTEWRKRHPALPLSESI